MHKIVEFIRHVLSHECGPFWQFIKYGAIGVMATCVQTGIFYLLAATCLRCLKSDDFAVVHLRLPAANCTDGERAVLFAIATAIGFVFANIFCWLMNRWFVFRPGRFRWYVEFGMFCGAATVATLIALGIASLLISYCGLMTTLAVIIEIFVSFLVNFFARKFIIFKG